MKNLFLAFSLLPFFAFAQSDSAFFLPSQYRLPHGNIEGANAESCGLKIPTDSTAVLVWVSANKLYPTGEYATVKTDKQGCRYWATMIVFQKPNGDILYSLNTVKETHNNGEDIVLSKAEESLRAKEFFSGTILAKAANLIPCNCMD